jgi:LysM repeat protein
MCGASLDVEEEAPEEAPRRRFRIPWRGILASIVTVAAFVGALGWVVREQIREQSRTPTPSPTLTATLWPSRTPTPVETPTPTLTPTPMPPRAHTVQQNETCISIANDYGISLEVMQSLNPEKCAPGAILHPGDPLLLPAATPTPGPTPTHGPGTVVPTPECPILHVVQPGETALGIAEIYQVPLALIEQANGVEDLSDLQVDQVLQIPCLDPTATPTPTPDPNATSTPIPRYAAPALLSPPDGATLTTSLVPLQWTTVSLLGENEIYVVRLRRLDQEMPMESIYVRETLVRLGEEYAPTPDDPRREYSWEVTVVREAGLNRSGELRYTAASFPSARRIFRWLAPEATPGASPTP